MSSFDSERSTTEEEQPSTIIQAHSRLITSIAEALQKVISHNQNNQHYQKILQHQAKSPFSFWQIPSISLEDYLERIQFYTKCEEPCIISSLIYIDRLSSIGHLVLTPYNVHIIVFCSILISIKFLEDKYFKMDYYSNIAGVSMKELKKLESTFLTTIKFHLFIDEDEYSQYLNYLLNEKP